MNDVLVIGSGPAGVAAALTVQAAGFKTAIATLDHSYLRSAPTVSDYYGLDQLSGEEIYQKGLQQALHQGIPVMNEPITGLTRIDGGFSVGIPNHDARCIILATGTPIEPVCPTFAAPYREKGVYFRVEEDGFHCRGRMVGVLGDGAYALAQAALLVKTARTVTLFTNGATTSRFPREIGVNQYPIASLAGHNRLEQICFENGAALNLDALFIADRTAQVADLAAGAGIKASRFLPVDTAGMTSVPGLFAAGDCTGKTKTLQEQTYDGYKVGQSVVAYLKK